MEPLFSLSFYICIGYPKMQQFLEQKLLQSQSTVLTCPS